LQAKADPFAPNSQAETPLKMAFKSVGNLRDFVKAAGISSTDVLGEGFLHYAVREGNMDAVKILLDMGLDKAAKNISGETPLDKAKAKNDAAMIAILSQ
ncbi:MAG TPA: ankyrin repeat domain-containing protein, partial [Rectinemataceae bacterium]